MPSISDDRINIIKLSTLVVTRACCVILMNVLQIKLGTNSRWRFRDRFRWFMKRSEEDWQRANENIKNWLRYHCVWSERFLRQSNKVARRNRYIGQLVAFQLKITVGVRINSFVARVMLPETEPTNNANAIEMTHRIECRQYAKISNSVCHFDRVRILMVDCTCGCLGRSRGLLVPKT